MSPSEIADEERSAVSLSGTLPPPSGRLRAVGGLIALAIFLVDTFTPLEGAVAVLYVTVVLLAAKISRRDTLAAAAGTMVLTILAYVDAHGIGQLLSPTLRLLVSLVAISVVTIMAFQNQRTARALRSQAELLNLSHDMIFVRGMDGRITFWNDGAAACYGWNASEALGRKADDLLGTQYPIERLTIEAEFLKAGRWEGVLRQRTRNGADIAVESRWALRRDGSGRPESVLETHRDVTEREASHVALAQSEGRYRRVFCASRVGLIQQDWSRLRAALQAIGREGVEDVPSYLAENPALSEELTALVTVTDVNPAMLAMVGADSTATFIGAMGRILSESGRTMTDSVLAFARKDRYHEGETELVTIDGHRVPVLFGLTFPEGEGASDVLIFVADLTEREKAQNALLAAQSELAHAARVATLGELTASIAHEVNQPLAAIMTNGEAALRWLRRDVPDLGEIEVALGRAITEGKRASAIVGRIRAFLTKAPVRREALNIAEMVSEAMLLVDRELGQYGVKVRVSREPHLPSVLGDRVQIQQVLVNLMVNGAQAMGAMPDDRLLTIRVTQQEAAYLAVSVEDSGPGISPEDLGRLFEPFFTTKKDGMGMGLAICRSTIEAHGGRLTAKSNPGQGATFTFTLPVEPTQAEA